MKNKYHMHRFWLILLFCLALVAVYSDAFARERGGERGKDRGRDRGKSHEVVIVGHDRYHYRQGRFYRPGWFGFEFAVVRPPFGAIITILPFGHRTIIAGGLTYYSYNDIYYRSCPAGYIVVPAPAVSSPVVAAAPQINTGETVTVNIPNSNGSYTAVVLAKKNSGYVGPQGEYYPSRPTVEQLRALYGS